jgi:SPP1 gp7 family putative phage head morphogenesis protein
VATIAEILTARRAFVGARRRPKAIPRQKEPRSGHMRYLRYLRKVLADRDQLIREQLRPELEKLIQQAELEAAGVRRDALADDILRVFGALRLTFDALHPETAISTEIAPAMADVAAHTDKEHQKQVKAGLGVELIVPEPFVSTKVREFVLENTRLVKTLVGQDFDRMQAIVQRGVTEGLRVEDIWRELRARLGISKSHARLLARDQTNKLAGQLTRLKQENIGVTHYTWDTSQDGRVRPRHGELHGTRQSWQSPPIVDTRTGRRAHPGGDYQCRCQGLPVFPAALLAA